MEATTQLEHAGAVQYNHAMRQSLQHHAILRFAPLLFAAALPSCRTTPVSSPGPAPRVMPEQFDAAESQFLMGDYAEAEKLFGALVDALPDGEAKARARYWRGVCRLKQDMPRVARRDFADCLSASQDEELLSLAKEGMADCERKLGRMAEAAKLYDSLASSLPSSPRKASLLQRRDACKAGGRPRPTAGAQGAFVVQLGVFSERKRADALASSVRSKGYTCSVERRRIAGRLLYRVRSGPFRTEAEAKRRVDAMKRAGFEAIVVP